MPKKSLAFVFCVAVIAVLSYLGWVNLKEVLFNGFDLVNILLTALTFLLVMAVYGVIVLIFNSWKMLVPVAGVILLIYILVCGFNLVYLAVVTAGLGFATLGIAETRKAKAVHLKILPRQIAGPAQKALFTALTLAIAVMIYFSPQARNLFSEIRIPRPLFDLVINSMSGFLQNQIDSQLKSSAPLSLSIPGMPPIAINDLNKFAGGRDVDMNEIFDQKTKDELYKKINEQLSILLEPYKRFSPYVLAAAIFFSLKTVGFILVWLAGLAANLIFIILKAVRVVSVGKEMVERETIEL